MTVYGGTVFADRREAGRQLAKALEHHAGEAHQANPSWPWVPSPPAASR